jgi:hypothetical protein
MGIQPARDNSHDYKENHGSWWIQENHGTGGCHHVLKAQKMVFFSSCFAGGYNGEIVGDTIWLFGT